MKKLYLSTSLLLIAYFSQAQINKGTVLVGGGLSVYSDAGTSTVGGQGQPETHFANFGIAPTLGYTVANNLVMGLNLAYAHGSQNPGGILDRNDYSIGVYLRKYKYLGDKFYFFSECDLGYFYSDEKDQPAVDNNTESKQSGVKFAFVPGVSYALSHRWQLEVAFPDVLDASYQHTSYTQIGVGGPATESKSDDNIFNLSTSLTTDFQLQVGVRFLIGS